MPPDHDHDDYLDDEDDDFDERGIRQDELGVGKLRRYRSLYPPSQLTLLLIWRRRKKER